MRKNLNAKPAEIPSNLSFTSKERMFFYKVLALIAVLFGFALVELFQVDFFILLDSTIAFFSNTPS